MKSLAALTALLTALLLPAGAQAAAGSLDKSFSDDGRLVVQATKSSSPGFAVTRLAAIPMASAAAPGNELFAANDRRLMLYRVDGRAQSSFGGNGRVVIPVTAETSFHLAGLAVDSRGRALVAGTTEPTSQESSGPPSSWITVYRFLGDGELDGSWGEDGIATVADSPFGGGEPVRATGLALDEYNRPVLTGFAVGDPVSCPNTPYTVYGNKTFVARIRNVGVLDPNFATAGFYTEAGLEDPNLPVISDSGAIVFANRTEARCPGEARGEAPVITELSSSGGFERRFAAAPDGGFEYIEPLSLDTDGYNRIVLLFSRTDGEGGDRSAHVRRLHADGTADASFGVEGATRPNTPAGGWLEALTTDGHNRVILAGSSPVNEGRGFLAMRLNAAGKLQTWFGDGGSTVTGFGSKAEAEASGVHRDESGRIVIGGTVEAPWVETGYGLAFGRYLSGGQ